jgi:hypothetical protein
MHYMLFEDGKFVDVEIPDGLAGVIKERVSWIRGILLCLHIALVFWISSIIGMWEPPWSFVEAILDAGYFLGGFFWILNWLAPRVEQRYYDRAAMRFRALGAWPEAPTLSGP